MGTADDKRTYRVEGMTCGHCEAAVKAELVRLPGVRDVVVDLDAHLVRVQGMDLEDTTIRAAIDAAGYAAEPAGGSR